MNTGTAQQRVTRTSGASPLAISLGIGVFIAKLNIPDFVAEPFRHVSRGHKMCLRARATFGDFVSPKPRTFV